MVEEQFETLCLHQSVELVKAEVLQFHLSAKFLNMQQVVEDFAKLDLLLKVKRGNKDEKFKVEVHHKNEGTYHLNHMEPDHS